MMSQLECSQHRLMRRVYRSIYSLIRIWIDSVRNVFRNFKYESLSQQNWRDRLVNQSVELEFWALFVGKLLFTFSHAMMALWSDK